MTFKLKMDSFPVYTSVYMRISVRQYQSKSVISRLVPSHLVRCGCCSAVWTWRNFSPSWVCCSACPGTSSEAEWMSPPPAACRCCWMPPPLACCCCCCCWIEPPRAGAHWVAPAGGGCSLYSRHSSCLSCSVSSPAPSCQAGSLGRCCCPPGHRLGINIFLTYPRVTAL